MTITDNCYPNKLKRLHYAAVLIPLVSSVLVFLLCLGAAIYGLSYSDSRGSELGLFACFMFALFVSLPFVVIASVSRKWPGKAALISLGLSFIFGFACGPLFITIAILNAIVWWVRRKNQQVQLKQEMKSAKEV